MLEGQTDTRFSTKFAIAATTAIMTVAAAGAAQAQGGFQWNPSQATNPGVLPSQISEPVNAGSAQALYLEQTGETRADAVATHEPGRIFATHLEAYSL